MSSRAARSGRFDPVAGGVQVFSGTGGTHGTLGLMVRDSLSGAKLALSNAHVLRGIPPVSIEDDEILQPSALADGNVIGKLLRWNDTLDCGPRFGRKVRKSGMLTEVTCEVGSTGSDCREPT